MPTSVLTQATIRGETTSSGREMVFSNSFHATDVSINSRSMQSLPLSLQNIKQMKFSVYYLIASII